MLFPTPNATADIDWSRETARYTDEVLRVLEARGYSGFGSGIEVQHVTTPAEWQERGMAAGAPFASAHTFFQTGPFRPGNLWGDNIVFTGSGTRPGWGAHGPRVGPVGRRTDRRPGRAPLTARRRDGSPGGSRVPL